jgi:hypothetical protein
VKDTLTKAIWALDNWWVLAPPWAMVKSIGLGESEVYIGSTAKLGT